MCHSCQLVCVVVLHVIRHVTRGKLLSNSLPVVVVGLLVVVVVVGFSVVVVDVVVVVLTLLVTSLEDAALSTVVGCGVVVVVVVDVVVDDAAACVVFAVSAPLSMGQHTPNCRKRICWTLPLFSLLLLFLTKKTRNSPSFLIIAGRPENWPLIGYR